LFKRAKKLFLKKLKGHGIHGPARFGEKR